MGCIRDYTEGFLGCKTNVHNSPYSNVCEWCADWYGDKYYALSPMSDPAGPSEGPSHVGRGGCWIDIAQHCRSAARGRLSSVIGKNFLGFRVARMAE